MIMTDPVVAADGKSYERLSVESWIAGNPNGVLGPSGGEPLAHTNLTPNHNLRSTIEAARTLWMTTH
jgi:hypothetical protein